MSEDLQIKLLDRLSALEAHVKDIKEDVKECRDDIRSVRETINSCDACQGRTPKAELSKLDWAKASGIGTALGGAAVVIFEWIKKQATGQ